MPNTDVVAIILDMFGSFLVYMLPVIGVVAGISFVMQALYSVTIGALTKAGRSL